MACSCLYVDFNNFLFSTRAMVEEGFFSSEKIDAITYTHAYRMQTCDAHNIGFPF